MRYGETLSIGGFGGEIIDDTVRHSGGHWGGVLALEDTVITSLTSNNISQNSAALTANGGTNANSLVTLKAGIFIPGIISEITLQSGSVYLPKIPSEYTVPIPQVPSSVLDD